MHSTCPEEEADKEDFVWKLFAFFPLFGVWTKYFAIIVKRNSGRTLIFAFFLSQRLFDKEDFVLKKNLFSFELLRLWLIFFEFLEIFSDRVHLMHSTCEAAIFDWKHFYFFLGRNDLEGCFLEFERRKIDILVSFFGRLAKSKFYVST